MAEARSRDHGASLARRQGFTLLELLVVIVIIGLLAAYVGPKYFSQLGKSEVTIAKAQIGAFEKALDTYRLDVGRYPTTEEGMAALLVAPASGAAKWNGPYLKKAVPSDPWGHPFQYRAPGAKGEFEIVSLGRDGQPGGSGEACWPNRARVFRRSTSASSRRPRAPATCRARWRATSITSSASTRCAQKSSAP
ncbi:MAG: type II secretion system major pseudopilin GspG [Massilia sp.]|nr:type II secretion system major pseudopilin GspG [Massilia sp.]